MTRCNLPAPDCVIFSRSLHLQTGSIFFTPPSMETGQSRRRKLVDPSVSTETSKAALSLDAAADTIVDVLQKLKSDDGDAARQLISALPASTLKTELDELVQRYRARRRELTPAATEMRALASTEGIDPEKVPVLLRRSRQTRPDQPIFLDICGISLDGGLYRLDEEQAFELFENRHHVITFPDAKSIRLPSIGEWCLWFVERYPTDQPIKYRLRKSAGSLYVVIDLAASFPEFDQVRLAIQEAAIESWMRPLFRLAGGGFLRAPNDVPGPVKGSFDSPLQFYRSIPVWNLVDTVAAVAPLPSPDGAYDCADLSVVTARILKESDSRQHLPEMTRSQVSALIESLRASDMGLTDQRLERVAQEFDRYIASAEKLQQVSAQVLQTSGVHASIASATEAAVLRAMAENQQLREERVRLEKELTELRTRRSSLVDENKRTGEELRSVVRKAFEKTKDAGVKSLGELAVFAALLAPQGSSAEEKAIPEHSMRVWEAERVDEPQRPLIDAGVSIGNARILTIAARLISNAGLSLLFVGARASQAAVAIGRGLARNRCVVAEVPVGLINSFAASNLLENSTKDDCLVIRNYNLSAWDAFGSPLIDLLAQSVVAGRATRAGIVLSASRGVAGLPLDDDAGALSVIVDSNLDYGSRTADFDVTVEELREDRTASRMRSLALAQLLDGSSDWPRGEVEALLAVIAAQRDVLANCQSQSTYLIEP